MRSGLWLRIGNVNHPEDLPSSLYGYGSIPIHTIFSGMNIHLPAILMWTTGVQGFDTLPYLAEFSDPNLWDQGRGNEDGSASWDPSFQLLASHLGSVLRIPKRVPCKVVLANRRRLRCFRALGSGPDPPSNFFVGCDWREGSTMMVSESWLGISDHGIFSDWAWKHE